MPTCPEVSISLESQYTFSFSIGGISLSLDGLPAFDQGRSGQFNGFQHGCSEPDIRVTAGWADQLPHFAGRKQFESGGVWSLFHAGPDLVFDFISPVTGPYPYRRLWVESSFRRAELTMNREVLAGWPDVFPLEYPADELLFTNYLANYALGVEVHGCGLLDFETGGHLLLGHSGAGKSTTARLWERIRKPEVLSDDRLILRIHDGELWMYGTPWHGEAVFASPGKAQLKRILILQHGTRNEIRELSRAQAVGELFARCFPPFHSAIALERTLDFLHRVTETVPCYTFTFLPDESAVETVLRLQ